MSLQELEAAVERLPPNELSQFMVWVQDFQADLNVDGVRRKRPRPFGLATGEFVVPDDFDAPLPEGVLRDFEGG